MKHLLIAAALAATAMASSAFAADVGVSVSIGQPGFYGRLDIGDYPYPQPRLIYREPRVVERVYVERDPIYLRVPPGHAKNWPRYCSRYDACGERVYFVQDSWYERDYVPYYHQRYYDRDDRRDRGGYRDNDRDEHRGHDRDDDRGHGNKHGHGHGRDH